MPDKSLSRQQHYRELMEQIRQAHQEFSDVWSSVRTAELLKHGLRPEGLRSLPFSQDGLLYEANEVAYRAGQPHSDKRDQLIRILFRELPGERIMAGNPVDVDAVLDFLEIDVPAFRCGYAAVWYLRCLKTLTLQDRQIHRLRQLAFDLCRCVGRGREWRETARLMIKLADGAFIQGLEGIASNQANLRAGQKAARMLQVVLNSRPDLR